jgi:hypothetical protein
MEEEVHKKKKKDKSKLGGGLEVKKVKTKRRA